VLQTSKINIRSLAGQTSEIDIEKSKRGGGELVASVQQAFPPSQ